MTLAGIKAAKSSRERGAQRARQAVDAAGEFRQADVPELQTSARELSRYVGGLL